LSECHTLLIVANDPVRSAELAAVFSDLKVTTSTVGEKALTLIRRIEPEVVLFDLGDIGHADEAQNRRPS
jgi:DNA-binding NarL/FixJ family response regulator